MQRFVYFFVIFPWLKFRMNWAKFLVMALPIVILAAVLTGINTLNTSITHIIDNKILPFVEMQERIITLDQSLGEQDDFFFNFNNNSLEFNDRNYSNFKPEEVEEMTTIAHTSSAGSNLDTVMLMGETDNLLDGHKIILHQFSGLSLETAQHLKLGDFTYTSGGVLPVVLGINALKEFKAGILSADSLNHDSQQELLHEYQEETTLLKVIDDRKTILGLIGQEFELHLGGIQWQPVLYRVAGGIENTFTFVPPEIRQGMQRRYYDQINRYWDVEQLKQGVTIRAKVVGVDATINTPAISIPNKAIPELHRQLTTHLQESLHTSESIPSEQELGSTYRGIVLDDGQIRADGGYLYFVDLLNQSTDLPGIFVPGLYYQSTDGEASQVRQLSPDEVGDVNFPIHQVVVVVENMDYMSTVWNNLYAMGYSSGKTTINNYRNAVNFSEMMRHTTVALKIPFMVAALIVVFFLMLRIAKTSDYETGVVRMLGATKDQVLLLHAGFFSQQLVVASLLGILLGYGLILASAPFIVETFLQQNQFKLEDISALYGRQIVISGGDLHHIDLTTLTSDLGLVLVVALVGLLVATLVAARVQPHTLVNNNRE